MVLALAWPTWGPARLAVQMARIEHGGWRVAPARIYRLLRRLGLPTRFQRLAVLETHSAQAAGLLTERTRRRLTATRRRRGPHVAAQRPGELICLDTFYIGKLKGVGKVWQYTACDAACSYAIAQGTTDFSAEAAVRFLTSRVLPAYRAAGVHPKAIQARLGHASITTTLNTYGHLMPSAFQGVGERLDALLQGNGKATSPA
jgi:transposase InsO family protein